MFYQVILCQITLLPKQPSLHKSQETFLHRSPPLTAVTVQSAAVFDSPLTTALRYSMSLSEGEKINKVWVGSISTIQFGICLSNKEFHTVFKTTARAIWLMKSVDLRLTGNKQIGRNLCSASPTQSKAIFKVRSGSIGFYSKRTLSGWRFHMHSGQPTPVLNLFSWIYLFNICIYTKRFPFLNALHCLLSFCCEPLRRVSASLTNFLFLKQVKTEIREA